MAHGLAIQKRTVLYDAAGNVVTGAEGSALASGILIQGDDGTDRKNINVDPTTGDVQVDLTNSIPAGTNAIGKLAANDGVDIGDVDVTSIVPGTAATNLGKAEDAAHNSGDTGVMMLAVRQDTQAAFSGTDGDYEPLQTDAQGNLRIIPGLKIPRGNQAYDTTTITSSTSETSILAAGAAGVYHDPVWIYIGNESNQSLVVTIQDGTGNTVLSFPVGPKGGGTHPVWDIEQASAATAWFATCDTSVASIHINILCRKRT